MEPFLPLLTLALAANFEAPPTAGQTWARPAEGEVVAANPPCFVFPASESHHSYRLELSPSADFGAPRVIESPWMLAVAPQALAPGTYHWRWRPSEVEEWSVARSFRVPEGLPDVPLPPVAELLKRIGTEHPRVVVTADQLKAWRAKANEQLGINWRRDLEQRATRLQQAELLPEPAMLPDRSDPNRLAIYQKTFQTTRPFFRDMFKLAEDYLLSGDVLSGQEAKRRLLHIVRWDPRGSTSLNHNDEPGTEVVRYCPIVYDWVFPLLTPAERQECLDCLTTRMQEMRQRWVARPFEKFPFESHNMGYYLPDMLGAALALAGDAPVDEMLKYALTQLWSPFYPPYGGSDGGWNEGPEYWGWMGGVCAWTYKLVEVATGVPIKLRSNVAKQLDYKLYGNPPYFRMSPFGDGQENPAGGGLVMAELAELYQNPYALWYADQQHAKPNGLHALLFPTDHLQPKPPLDLRQNRAFYDVGLACSHSNLAEASDNVALLLRSCPFGGISHAYADQNTYAVDAYGEPLLIASGYYQLYGCPHHQQWTRQTIASNSVLVNGQGQQRTWQAKGELKVCQSTVAGDYLVGDAHLAYAGLVDRYDRRILYLRGLLTGGEPVIVIRDDLASPEPATWQFLLHALREMQVDESNQRVEIASGNARCRVDFLEPRGLAFSQHDQFTQPPVRGGANQWHLTASTTTKQPTEHSLFVIQPYRAGPTDLATTTAVEGHGAVGLRLQWPGWEVLVAYRTDPDATEVSVGEYRFDGQAIALGLRDGNCHAAAQFGGTYLAQGQTDLVQCSVNGAAGWGDCGQGQLAELDTPGAADVRIPAGEIKAAKPCEVLTFGNPASAATQPVPLVTPTGPVAWQQRFYPRVQRVVLTAPTALPGGTYELSLDLRETAGRASGALASVGSASSRVVVSAGGSTTLRIPAISLGGQDDVSLTIDGAGGSVGVTKATLERVYGVNLLPNPSFEEFAAGMPVGWSPGTITNGARCTIVTAEGGHNGQRHLRVTCTEPGGDFGVNLQWPGIPAADLDRKFELGCWVKTPASAVSGVQVTSQDWRFWKTTERLRGQADWAESRVEFTLPAGTDLSHLRLHQSADAEGVVIEVDEVYLRELK